MRKKVLLFLSFAFSLCLLCGCSTSGKEKYDDKWCKDFIEKYNSKSEKQIISYDVVDDQKQINKYTITSDITTQRTISVPEDPANSTYIYSLEDKTWYCYTQNAGGDERFKSQLAEEEGKFLLNSCDIKVSADTKYKIIGEEKKNGYDTVKVKMTRLVDGNYFNIPDEKDIAQELNNKDFKKAYDALKNKKEISSYIWIDTKTKFPVYQEIDITSQTLFFYYYKKELQGEDMVMQDNQNDSAPKSVMSTTQFVESFDSTIELPESNKIIEVNK